jgi:hypothetical protein
MRLFTVGLGCLLTFCMVHAQTDQAIKDEIAALKQQIEEFNQKLQALESRLSDQQAIPTPAAAPATNLPQISVVSNGAALFSDRSMRERNRFELDELELAFQSFVYPSIRFDAIMAMGKDAMGGGFEAELEEAYATVLQIGNTPFGARLGRTRLPFGRVAPIHPHARLFQDNPLPIENFLGEEGAASNGAVLSYLVPSSKVYATVQAGLFTLNEGEQVGANDLIRTARVLVAPTLDRNNELEIGFSGLTGKAENGDPIRLLGTDFQYRRFFGAAQRLLLSGEWLQHRRGNGGTNYNRDGFYLLASWKQDHFWEYGVRYDQSRRPFPGDPEDDAMGRDRALSVFLTYRLNEQSFIRLQWRNLKLSDDRARNNLILQFMFGFGPHSHPLESSQ